jgi:hypothetical protein
MTGANFCAAATAPAGGDLHAFDPSTLAGPMMGAGSPCGEDVNYCASSAGCGHPADEAPRERPALGFRGVLTGENPHPDGSLLQWPCLSASPALSGLGLPVSWRRRSNLACRMSGLRLCGKISHRPCPQRERPLSKTRREAASTQGPPSELVGALRQLLRPLVRLLLSHHLTYPFLTSLLKESFLEVAEQDFALEDKAQTNSRLSLLSGVHRKDVKRLRGRGIDDPATPPTLSLGSKIVARWTTLPEYLDEAGRPRPLPRQAPAAGGASFEALVESVSRDIRPRAVLDEWLRLGVAHLDAAGCVELDTAAFIPSKGFGEKTFLFGRNLRDHIAAGVHNLLGGDPPFVDRSVYYEGLSDESVRELKQLSEKKGMEALQAVNRWAMKLRERDRGRRDSSRHINFGIYVYDAAAPREREPERGDEG